MRTIILCLLICCGLKGQYRFAGFNEGAPGTPIDSNSGGGCTGSSGAWTCTGAATVTLTDAGALTIYYTVDGSTPSCPSTGTIYTTPFTSPGTTFTLKAIGCNGVTGGGVLTSVYTISGAITVTGIGSNSSNGANTMVITTTATCSSGGGVLVGLKSNQNLSTFVTSVTDSSGGNTYRQITTNSSDIPGISYAPMTSTLNSGGTITVHLANSANGIGGVAYCASSMSSPAADQQGFLTGFPSSNTPSFNTGSLTATDIVFCMHDWSSAGAAFSSYGAGFTGLDSALTWNSYGRNETTEWKLQSSGSAATCTVTLTGNPNNLGVGAALKHP